MGLCNCDFKNTFPGISLKYSFYGLPLHSLPRKITYIMTVLRQKLSQIWLFRFPKPHLTPGCYSIVVGGLPPSYGMDINTLDVIKLIQIKMEFRISEDYCRCDIYVVVLAISLLSYLKESTFNVEEFRIICPCTKYIHFLRI